MKVRYGKSYDKSLMKIKEAFYTENDDLLKQREYECGIYSQQPARKACKMCGGSLKGCRNFVNHGIRYYYCDHCHHVNGAYEETAEFSEKIYVEADYGKVYHEKDKEDFFKRTQCIYQPKMDFLLQSLEEDNCNKECIKILDVGAGSGYFVQAGLDSGVDIMGIEVSDKQVAYGNRLIGRDKLKQVAVHGVTEYIKRTDCNVLTMIGVLEHLIDFHEVIEAVCKNEHICYFYFSVPLFSFTFFLESVFTNGYNRQTGGGHTHLFTLDSLQYMKEQYRMKELARWQFGTDIMDLHRFLSVSLSKENNDLQEIMDQIFLGVADELQLVLDRNNCCSEVHMLVKKQTLIR